jgi:putative oxidoreductase
MQLLTWALQLIVAGILAQTLFFKFTGAAESVYIFSTLGMEPWGRYASGVAELIAAVLLVIPGCVSHLTVLGIEVQGDGGLLFALAVIVFISSLAILALRWRELPVVGALLASSSSSLH